MDEIFDVADFSNVDDLGVAARQAKQAKQVEDDVDHAEDVHVSKV